MNDFQNAVETSDLCKHFGNFSAVDKVNFYIPKGEIFGLLGPNGAGKTTTIRMLCGLMRPTSGRATVLGYDIVHQAEEIKRQIGYMSQKFSLYNDLTARENIDFYATVYRVPRSQRPARVQELLEMAGLKDHARRRVSDLSGAWRQRLALACAIVHKPPMLFLDEATAGVDPVSRREFWDLIYRMAADGTSVLATTHYMDEAEYCNTIGMMYRGALIAVASPDTLKDNMPGKLVQIDCDSPINAEKVLKDLSAVTDVAVHGTILHATLQDLDMVPQVMTALADADILVHSIEAAQPSLEDVFIGMVAQQRLTSDGAMPFAKDNLQEEIGD